MVLVSCGVTLNVIAHYDLVSTNSKEQPSPSHRTVTNSYIVCVHTPVALWQSILSQTAYVLTLLSNHIPASGVLCILL